MAVVRYAPSGRNSASIHTRLRQSVRAACFFLIVGCEPAIHEVHWGYSGEGAPEYWADLDADFALCRNGVRQSPGTAPRRADDWICVG